MRLILASSALLIIYIDPSEPDRLAQVTYASLVLYILFSCVLYLVALLRPAGFGWLSSWVPWMDVGWYIVLVALSSGTNSIFFFFFFFPILVSSFCRGFQSGLRVTVVSAICFIVVGYMTAPAEPHFQLNRFLLRPVYLVVLGYMIAYWGGYEIKLKERLKFLREISSFSNPRFGVDQTVNWMMERLRSFYDADRVILILLGEDGNDHVVRRVNRNEDGLRSSQTVSRDVAGIFLSPSPEEAVLHNGPTSGNTVYQIARGEISKDKGTQDLLLNAIESQRFLSVPINYRGRHIGRCYLVGGNSKYQSLDVDFLLQAIDQVLPMIDNIRLVDHLASDAAEHEREKIARDIHDSVIQPYIGFQLGLTGIIQKLERGDNDVAERARELADLTAKGISDLRQYMRGVKGTEAAENNLLLPALRRFASNFSKATGINVKVEGNEAMAINDRLAGEVFQMINEGLSNVRRHSHAQTATAALTQHDGKLVVRIENDNAGGSAKRSFHPQSLADRVADLGGELTVETEGRITAVNIEIPL